MVARGGSSVCRLLIRRSPDSTVKAFRQDVSHIVIGVLQGLVFDLVPDVKAAARREF